MEAEKAALLQTNQEFVCANVMLALNKAGVFKLQPKNMVAYDAAAVKAM